MLLSTKQDRYVTFHPCSLADQIQFLRSCSYEQIMLGFEMICCFCTVTQIYAGMLLVIHYYKFSILLLFTHRKSALTHNCLQMSTLATFWQTESTVFRIRPLIGLNWHSDIGSSAQLFSIYSCSIDSCKKRGHMYRKLVKP